MNECAQCGSQGDRPFVQSRPWFKPNKYDSGVAPICDACWVNAPFDSGRTVAYGDGSVAVINEFYEDVEPSHVSIRLLARDGKRLDVSTWGGGRVWTVFEEA